MRGQGGRRGRRTTTSTVTVTRAIAAAWPASTPLRKALALLAAATVLAGCSHGSDGGGSASSAGGRPAEHPTSRPSPLWNPRPDSLASVGDSITRGFDACSVLSDCPEVSWSTGTEVNSVARRLLPAGGGGRDGRGRQHSWNHARTGALMADLPAQMRAAAAHRPELVTVMIGANDACRESVAEMTPTADFQAGFAASLKALRRTAPKAQVYVASVPDLGRLWSQGRRDPLGKQVWKLGICPALLKDADATDAASVARRGQVEDRVEAYNGALEAVCDRDPLCRYDGAVHDYRFTTAELSPWDCFHPSRQGQQVLADLAYREITRKDPRA